MTINNIHWYYLTFNIFTQDSIFSSSEMLSKRALPLWNITKELFELVMISNFHQNEGLMKDRNQDPLILSYSSMDPHLIWLRSKETREREERENDPSYQRNWPRKIYYMILRYHYAFQYFCIKYRLLLVILFFTSQYNSSPSVRNILLIKFDNKVNLYFEEQYSFESFRKQNKKLRAKRGGPNTLKILVLSKQTCSVRITTKTIQKGLYLSKLKGP